MAKKLKVTLVRSGINRPEPQKRTIQRAGAAQACTSRVVLPDNLAVRGMIRDGLPPGHGRGGRVAANVRARIDHGHHAAHAEGAAQAPPGTASASAAAPARAPARQSGKGVKGQKARTGHHGARFGFEGGQMPMQRRLPKGGFKNPFRDRDLRGQPRAPRGHLRRRRTVDLAELQAAAWCRARRELVKVLGDGELTKKLTVKAHAFSAAAKAKIEKARRHRRGRRRRSPRRSDARRSDRWPPAFAEHRQDPGAPAADAVHAGAAGGLPHRRLRHHPGVEPGGDERRSSTRRRARSWACSTCSRAARSSRCRSSRSASCRTSARRSSCSC